MAFTSMEGVMKGLLQTILVIAVVILLEVFASQIQPQGATQVGSPLRSLCSVHW
jgi:hypothetical protein